MSRDLNLLTTEFKMDIEEVLISCKLKGIDIVPFYTIRSPESQAKLYRQSRSWREISNTIEMLSVNNAKYLSYILYSVGPQYGKGEVTKAYPGLSWHQFGEAVDCFVLYDEKAIWDDNHPYYAKYALIAKSIGLEAGFYWDSFKDACHIQKRKGSPLDYYSLKEIDKLIEEKFKNE